MTLIEVATDIPNKMIISTLVIGLLSILLYSTFKTRKNPPNAIPIYPGALLGTNFFQLVKSLWSFSLLEFHERARHLPIVQLKLLRLSNKPQAVIVNDPTLAREVLLTRHSEFIRTPFLQYLFKGIANYALFLIPSGKDWKKHRYYLLAPTLKYKFRKLLQPSFGPNHLRRVFEITVEETNLLFDVWKTTAKDKTPICIRTASNALATDVIGRVGFSYEFGSVQGLRNGDKALSEMGSNLMDMMKVVPRRVLAPFFIWKLLKIHPDDIKVQSEFVKSTIRKVIDEKIRVLGASKPLSRVDSKWKLDLLDILIENSHMNKGEDGAFTIEELEDEVLGFFLAGQGTTTNSMTFTVLELCRNPVVFGKVREEVDKVMESGELTSERLPELKYLDAVVKESLRLYPIVAAYAKTAANDLVLGGYEIPKNCRLTVSAINLHRNEKYWKQPYEFLPERWMEPGFTPKAGSYVPFGDGPQNCIGQKMAMIEIKTFLALLVRNQDVELVPGQDLRIESNIATRLKSLNLMVKVSPREF